VHEIRVRHPALQSPPQVGIEDARPHHHQLQQPAQPRLSGTRSAVLLPPPLSSGESVALKVRHTRRRPRARDWISERSRK
jgi:hypothetical protein